MLGFTELLAVGPGNQMGGHDFGVGILPVDLADELHARGEVAPLVVAADLDLAAIIVVQAIEVDGLEDLIGEFGEGDSGVTVVYFKE